MKIFSKFIFIFLLLFLGARSALLAYEEDCPFCNSAIIEKQYITETEHLYALYCLTPATKGHLLIIPKRHIIRLEELSSGEMSELSELTQQFAPVFKELYGVDDYLVLQKNGKNAGQQVPHIHFHLVPCDKHVTWIAISSFLYCPKISDYEMHLRTSELQQFLQEKQALKAS